ncbi:MAG: hypothetical protein JWO73_331 [Candidatus Taylorbacteria bacterium]|nr:hypothetical protein [Candidatus Taylorbacteria bacterium]
MHPRNKLLMTPVDQIPGMYQRATAKYRLKSITAVNLLGEVAAGKSEMVRKTKAVLRVASKETARRFGSVSTTGLIKMHIEAGSPLGLRYKAADEKAAAGGKGNIQEQGLLQSDDLMILALMLEIINELRLGRTCILFDSLRSGPQAKWLSETGMTVKTIRFTISLDESRLRILVRQMTGNPRPDDARVETRWHNHHREIGDVMREVESRNEPFVIIAATDPMPEKLKRMIRFSTNEKTLIERFAEIIDDATNFVRRSIEYLDRVSKRALEQIRRQAASIESGQKSGKDSPGLGLGCLPAPV